MRVGNSAEVGVSAGAPVGATASGYNRRSGSDHGEHPTAPAGDAVHGRAKGNGVGIKVSIAAKTTPASVARFILRDPKAAFRISRVVSFGVNFPANE